jgi:uncharacterized protein (DUF983 family)
MPLTSLGTTLLTIIRLSCPICQKGQMFKTLFQMNDTCPHCHYRYDRGEHGYFSGAMYISYAIMVAVLVGLTIAMWILSLPGEYQLSIYIVSIILIGPLTFSYSRLLWVLLCVSFDSTHR